MSGTRSGIEPSANPSRRPDGAALIIALILIAIAALLAFDTSRLGGGGAYARIGPATVPYAIAACLAGLSIWTLIAAFRRDFPEREPQEFAPVLWIVGGLVAQMVLIKFTGFSIATGILFAMTARGFARINFAIVLPAGIILSGLIWLIFAKLLQLSLPAGLPEQWLGAGAQWLVTTVSSLFQRA